MLIQNYTIIVLIIFNPAVYTRNNQNLLDSDYLGYFHISYASECEEVDELRKKLAQRRSEVEFLVNKYKDGESLKRTHESSEENNEHNINQGSSSKKNRNE